MPQAKTKQLRAHIDCTGKRHWIEHVCIEEPATELTWLDNVSKLSEELGLPALEVHERLFAILPELFGSNR